MKTTFLVRDGLTQVVLHPETRAERAVLDVINGAQDKMSVEVYRADFSESKAGYIRDFSKYPTSPFQSEAHLPDTVLVMRPVEPQEPTVVEKIPDDVDLVKKTDGSWLYRNHVDTWQGCPPPFSPGGMPDDTRTYYRVLKDGTWQVYSRDARVWVPASNMLQDLVDSPDADASELKTMAMEMELILEHCTKITGFDAQAKLNAITALVKSSVERRK